MTENVVVSDNPSGFVWDEERHAWIMTTPECRKRFDELVSSGAFDNVVKKS